MAKEKPRLRKILGARARMTSKGQVTIPKVFRERFGLKPGVELHFSLDPWGHIVVSPINVELEDLIGMLPKPEHPLTIEEMDDAVTEAVTESVARSRSS